MELTIEQMLQQGVAAHKEGKVQDAESLYRAILQSQPLHPDANHNLGILALSVNKANVALPLFKTALEANAKVEQFWLSYIDALIKDNQIKDAKWAIKKAKKKGFDSKKLESLWLPSKVLLHRQEPSQQQLNSLLEYYQNGQYGDAESLALSITEKFPEHQFSWKVLGAVLKKTDRKSESLIASQKSVQLQPQDVEASYNLGNTLKELGRLDEAEVCYMQVISLKPGYAEAHYNLGNTLKELGRLDDAEASYSQAIALKPDYTQAHSNLGITLQELGRLDEAEAHYMLAIALKPGYVGAHNKLGVTLKELGRLEESEASLRQAIVLKPDSVAAHNNLGVTLEEMGRLDEAEASYTQAIVIQPDFTAALMNRWLLLFNKREFDAALKDIDLCNTKKSRACGLETLYELGRIDEIYKRIEVQSEQDDSNIRIAAFSSFISEREKKDTAHKFCRNPLAFIHFANVSSYLDDSNEFVRDVIDELHNVKTRWEPPQKATLKGFQTPSHINLFASPSGKMTQLKSIICNELDSYYLKFQNESCSYIQKWPSKKDLHGWHVILKQQGYQKPHIHPSGWLSGVIYLKVIPSLGKDEGAIEFSLNSENYSDLNSPKLTYQPELGDIVFFPSSLHHRTIPFTTDADRIIVSFDLKPETVKY